MGGAEKLGLDGSQPRAHGTTRGTGQKWRKADTATTSKLSFSLIADPGGQRPGEPPVQGGQGGHSGQGGQGGQGGQVKQEPEQLKLFPVAACKW